MCGIVFAAQWDTAPGKDADKGSLDEILEQLHMANSVRGPDAQRRHQTSTTEGATSSSVHLDFFSSELLLRGDAPVVQPHVHPNGDVLCWNGEIFQGLDIHPEENDGVKLFDALTGLMDASSIVQLFGTLEGPYAFVFYHHRSKRLFFARDPLGRRSLLIHKPSYTLPYMLLASVSVGANPSYDLAELSTEFIYCLDLSSFEDNAAAIFDACLESHQRLQPNSGAFVPFARPARVNRALPEGQLSPSLSQSLDFIPPFLATAVDDLISHLDRSVALRVRNIPRGGAAHRSNGEEPPLGSASARVAVLFSGGIDSTTCAFLAHRHVPLEEPIDLLNIAFENPRKIRLQVDGNAGGMSKKKKKAKVLQDAAPVDGPLLERYSPDYLVPDRITGLTELEELRRLCPGRQWNFVEIDVPYSEYQAAHSTVKATMWPGRTIMDLSLAMALYFAARGIGQVRSSGVSDPVPYASPARVLLNGLGSDELLGGYGRHRTAYNAGGWQAVIDELQLEMDRIPTRNLGRDDRMISAHGKETRHPFLSLDVVNFLAVLPVHYKVDPRLEVGIGDKMLLRLATRKLGLVEASSRKKRAMQFGSHSARMEVGVPDGGGTSVVS
ncbi:asparagine synthase-domain-containing protein [Gloeopeniophorella convolvens]|nr:asparagine synthase-domain-containing protein [Gloeopeniophorella convolvens]